MNIHFFGGMLAFGALVGGFMGGTNFRHYFKSLKNDSGRDQKKVIKQIVVGVIIGAVMGAVIGFFVR